MSNRQTSLIIFISFSEIIGISTVIPQSSVILKSVIQLVVILSELKTPDLVIQSVPGVGGDKKEEEGLTREELQEQERLR